MTYPNAIFSTFAFLGFIASCIPFAWHLEAWNTGTCLFMLWTGLACLNQFINSVIWNDNAINIAPVWCDISSKFIIGTSVAIPAASLCINRRLYQISTSQVVTTTRSEKRRAVMVDLAIGVGLPVLEMILHYVGQGHRFDIYENVGCFPSTYVTPIALVLVFLFPLCVAIASSIYCVLSIRAFYKIRRQFNNLMSTSSSLNSSRYLRLMCLAGIDLSCDIALNLYFIISRIVDNGIAPWRGWEDTHSNFSRVESIPAIFWRSSSNFELQIELTRWIPIVCAIIFFAFFGFADEAMKNYRSAMQSVTKKLGVTSFGSTTLGSRFFSSTFSKEKGLSQGSQTTNTLPISVSREVYTSPRRRSESSFTDVSSSFGDTSSIYEEKEKTDISASTAQIMPTLNYENVKFCDVGAALESTKSSTPATLSAASSNSDIAVAHNYVTSHPRDGADMV